MFVPVTVKIPLASGPVTVPCDWCPSPHTITTVGLVVAAAGFESVNVATVPVNATPGVIANVVGVAVMFGLVTRAMLFAVAERPLGSVIETVTLYGPGPVA